MPYTRHISEDGILITETCGVLSPEDCYSMLKELPEYAVDNRLYELVIHSDDTDIDVTQAQNYNMMECAKDVFQGFTRGAIAVVASQDCVFGKCRQFQLPIDNDQIQLCTFRTREEAYKWLRDLQGS